MKNKLTGLPIASILALVLAAAGCASKPKMGFLTQNSVAAGAVATNSAKVALVLPPDLTTFLYEAKFGGSSRKYELGEPLKHYSINSAKGVFKDVQVYESALAAAGKADAILIPRVGIVDFTACVGASGDRHMLLTVEWALMDRDNQSLLWLETSRGVAEEPHAMIGKAERNMLQNGFNNLTIDTVRIFRETAVIQRLASKGP